MPSKGRRQHLPSMGMLNALKKHKHGLRNKGKTGNLALVWCLQPFMRLGYSTDAGAAGNALMPGEPL